MKQSRIVRLLFAVMLCLALMLVVLPKSVQAEESGVWIAGNVRIGSYVQAKLWGELAEIPNQGDIQYRWNCRSSEEDKWSRISEEKGFVIAKQYLGYQLQVIVWEEGARPNPPKYSSQIVTVMDNFPLTGTAVLPGAVQVGDTITPTLSGNVEGTYNYYQWECSNTRGGWEIISGATSSSYEVKSTDKDKYLRVVITANGYSGSVTSDGSLVLGTKVGGKISLESSDYLDDSEMLDDHPRIGAGGTISAVLSGQVALLAPEKIHYQWQTSPNDLTWTDISGATGSSYTIPEDHQGGVYLRVSVSVSGCENPVQSSYVFVEVVNKKDVSDIFVDVPKNAWYHDAVQWVYDKELMTGMNPTVFGPTGIVSRAQFAVIVWRMKGSPKMTYMEKFPDVAKGTWYTDAVLWANSAGVVTGYQSGYFGPSDTVTREQMAVMMYRYTLYQGWDVSVKGSLENFADGKKVSQFAKEAMEWAVGNKIISGKQNGTMLDPQGRANRAECAQIIYNYNQADLDGAAG